MSKADSLLKKVAVYERLALYSDRKSFLQALAALKVPASAIESLKPQLDGVLQAVQSLNVGNYASIESAIMSGLNFNVEGTLDIDVLINGVQMAQSAMYTKLKSQQEGDPRDPNNTERMDQAVRSNPQYQNVAGIKSQLDQIRVNYSRVSNEQGSSEQSEMNLGVSTVGPTAPAAPKTNYQGALASAQYMAQQSATTISKLFDPKGPQASLRQYQITKGLRPQIQMMFNMFRQSKDNATKKVLYEAIQKAYASLGYDDMMLIPEFDNGSAVNKLQTELNNNDNPYV